MLPLIVMQITEYRCVTGLRSGLCTQGAAHGLGTALSDRPLCASLSCTAFSEPGGRGGRSSWPVCFISVEIMLPVGFYREYPGWEVKADRKGYHCKIGPPPPPHPMSSLSGPPFPALTKTQNCPSPGLCTPRPGDSRKHGVIWLPVSHMGSGFLSPFPDSRQGQGGGHTCPLYTHMGTTATISVAQAPGTGQI